MRIRGTKPEFWRSQRIAAVSWDARLVLKGLESYVDDNGVGKDDIALIVGDLFQRDLVREPSRTLARVSEAISELCAAGLLWRYEHEGTELLYVSFWEQAQRVDKPQAGRFPRPDGTWNYKDSDIRESSKNVREPSRTLAPVTGEQGNRGTEEKDIPSTAVEDRFDEFWDIYPRKVSKKNAKTKWDTLMKRRIDPDRIISGAKVYARAVATLQPEHIKHPDGWLNGERWEDDVRPPTQPYLQPVPAYTAPPAADPDNLPWLKK